jgi:hypothetical protein
MLPDPREDVAMSESFSVILTTDESGRFRAGKGRDEDR